MLHEDSARREGEGQPVATEGVPDALAYERVGVVVARVVGEPVFHFVLDRRVAEVAYAYDRRHVAQDVFAFTNGFADGVDDFDGRVVVGGGEEDDARVLVI